MDDAAGTDKDGSKEMLATMRSRMRIAIDAYSTSRRTQVEDLRFFAGNSDNRYQWPSDVLAGRGELRGGGARPCLTINKLPQHVRQVTNDQRQNRPSGKVIPADDKADVKVAEIYDGIVKHIEYMSDADVAYDTACENQTIHGEGFVRLVTEYCSDDTFEQDVRIVRVRNPFSVYLDPLAQDPCGSDAGWGFVTEDVTHDNYHRQWPNAQPVSSIMTTGAGDQALAVWLSEKTIRIAEYFYVDIESKRLNLYPNGITAFEGSPEDKRLRSLYAEPLRHRMAEKRTVKWVKTNGFETLEKSVWPGRWIPIVRVVGNEYEIDGRLEISGLVRGSKDAQRMYNYWPLALDTPVPTPEGWSTIGDLVPGDEVFDEQGSPVEVVGTTDVFLGENCYRVTFDNGSSIVASGNHQWRIERRGCRTSAGYDWSDITVSTIDLTPGNDFVPATRPLQTHTCLTLDPYFLGVWLGDGDSSGPLITQNKDDAEEMIDILVSRGLDAGNLRAASTACRFSVYGVRSEMARLDLLGNKHIPADYLRAPIEARLELLRGLMDTDGSVGANGQCSISTVFPTLRDGISELLASLGVKFGVIARDGRLVKSPNGKTYIGADHWQISFSHRSDLRVFNLTRKIAQTTGRVSQPRRTTRFGIASVDRVASVPVKCITVANESHLFLAGTSMVPTHNCSQEAEMLALAPKAPFIGYGGQFEGYENNWKTANTSNHPYLEVNADATDGQGNPLPLPQRAQPPMASSGLLQAKMGASEDIKSTTGQYDASLGIASNERSGKAILARQKEGDTGTYHYVDNLARAVRYVTRQIVDLIPKVYDTQRIARIIGEDEEVKSVKIDPLQKVPRVQVTDEQGVVIEEIYNPGVGRYDVRVVTGPGYATKRQEALEAMAQLLQGNPELWKVAGDLFVKNMDWPGAQEMAKRFARTIPPEIADDSDENPALQAAKLQMQQMAQEMEQMHKMLQGVQTSIEARELQIKEFEAETKRIAAVQDKMTPEQIQEIVMGTLAAVMDNEASEVANEPSNPVQL